MDDGFERAVAVTGDPAASAAARAASMEYFDRVCQHPDGWRLCLDKFLTAPADDVRFCSLQLLQLELQRGRLAPDAARTVRETLMAAAATVLPHARCSPAVLNKCAQLLVGTACLLPPAEWPALVDSLLAGAATSPATLDMLLRFLRYFQDDVVDQQQQQQQQQSSSGGKGAEYAAAVKDALRVRTTAQLAQLWFAVLTSCADTQPALVHAVLGLVARLEAWIPAPLVASAPFLQRLLELLQDRRYAAEACACIAAVVEKGTEPAAKIELVAQLRVADIAAAVRADSPLPVLHEVAHLLAAACGELLDAADKCAAAGARDACTAAGALFAGLVGPLAVVLAHADRDVSATALSVVDSFLTRYRGVVPGCAPCPEHVQRFLPVILAKIGAEQEEEGDDEEDNAETQEEFGQLFCAAVRVDPAGVLGFVEAAVASACTGDESTQASPERAVAALHLLTLFGDGVASLRQQQQQRTKHRKRKAPPQAPPPPAPSEAGADGVLERVQQLIVLLATRGLGTRQWPEAVVLAFLECVAQYSTAVAAVPAAAVPVVQAFLDDRGVRSRDGAVCSRAAVLLQRFLRGAQTHLAPYIADIVAGLLPVLAQPGADADRLGLYECLGAVLGARPPAAPELLREVVAPLHALLMQAARAPATPADGEAAWRLTLARQALAALTALSKGFALQETVDGDAALARVFAETLPALVALLAGAPRDPGVWQQAATFVHRIVDALGAHALPCLGAPLQQLWRTVVVPDSIRVGSSQQEQQQFFMCQLSELLSLVGQVVGRFHERAMGVCEDVLAQTVALCTDVVAPRAAQCAPGSEEAREVRELHRLFVQCLSVVAREAPALLLAPALAPRLTDALRYVLDGAAAPDVAHRRAVVRVLARLVDVWCAQTPLPGFADFVAGTVVPVLLRALVAAQQPPLVVTDGLVAQYIAELARFLVQAQAAVPAVCERLHSHGSTALRSAVACDCPESTAELFLVAVAAQETDVVSQGLKYFVQLHQAQQAQQQQQQQQPLAMPLPQTPSPVPRPASL